MNYRNNILDTNLLKIIRWLYDRSPIIIYVQFLEIISQLQKLSTQARDQTVIIIMARSRSLRHQIIPLWNITVNMPNTLTGCRDDPMSSNGSYFRLKTNLSRVSCTQRSYTMRLEGNNACFIKIHTQHTKIGDSTLNGLTWIFPKASIHTSGGKIKGLV